MGAFERNFVLFVVVILSGYGALYLMSMLIPGKKGG